MSTIEELIVAEVVKSVVSEGLRRSCTHDQVAALASEAVLAALAALEQKQAEKETASEQ